MTVNAVRVNGAKFVTYPELVAEGGHVADTAYPYGDLRRYGGAVDGVTDDTQALLYWAQARQAGVRAPLVIDGDTVLASTAYSGALPASPLFSFSGLNGVRVIALGTVTVPRVFTVNTTLDLFNFTDCSGVDLDLPNVVGDAASGASQTVPTGAYVARLLGGCRNVKADIKGTNCAGLLMVTAPSGSADSARTKGITLDLTVNNCLYGFNAQFSGDDVRGTIVSDTVHRSYFIYGVRGHDVLVDSKNNHADDVLIRGYSGFGCSDIHVTYINRGSTSAATAAPGVSIAPDVSSIDLTPCTMRNITVDIHVEWDGTNGPGHAFYLYKTIDDTTLDTTDRGHVIDGLTIRLYAKGSNSGNTAYPSLLGGTWGGGETMSNIRVERAKGDGVNAAMYFMFPSLKDRAIVQNVVSSSYVYLSAGAAGKMSAIGCKAPALLSDASDTSWIDYTDCEITTADHYSFVNKTYRNTSINGAMYNILGRTGDHLSFHGVGGASAPGQAAAIADASGTLADITTKFNTLLAALRLRGDIAP